MRGQKHTFEHLSDGIIILEDALEFSIFNAIREV